jgi:glycosyltransferase involved in cell wall biosynthesis
MIAGESSSGDSLRARPRVSIIIATYNAAATLQECISSIVRQSFPDWEVLVADGASKDATVDLIRANEQHLAWWHSSPDSGIYDAWNKALEHAQGDYVMFLGADDSLDDSATLARVFDALGEIAPDLVTGLGRLVSEDGSQLLVFGRPWDFRKVERRMTVCHPGMLHGRHLFDLHGRFDTGYRICADYDFILRLPESTTAVHVDMPIARIRDSGISRNRRWLMLDESRRAQARCPRVGTLRAGLVYLDRLWRWPVARILGIPN